MAWARVKNIRAISTTQIYGINGDGDGYDYCLAGTDGQKKIRYTLRHRRTGFPADGCTDLPRNILKQYDQVILEKRCPDPFKEPRADRMFSELKADEFIIFGGTAEGAVKATALGLLTRRKNVTILVDAVGCRDKSAANIALRQMEAKGARLRDTKTLCGPSSLNLVGICDCSRCQRRLRKTVTSAAG